MFKFRIKGYSAIFFFWIQVNNMKKILYILQWIISKTLFILRSVKIHTEVLVKIFIRNLMVFLYENLTDLLSPFLNTFIIARKVITLCKWLENKLSNLVWIAWDHLNCMRPFSQKAETTYVPQQPFILQNWRIWNISQKNPSVRFTTKLE